MTLNLTPEEKSNANTNNKNNGETQIHTSQTILC